MIFVNCYYCQINVLINNQSGDYKILLKNQIWLHSSYTGLYLNNQWFKTIDGSLQLIDCNFEEGFHYKLGQWNETQLIYHLNRNDRYFNVTGRIRQWKSHSAITFYFDNQLIAINNDITLHMDRVQTVFPSFLIEKLSKDDHRGYFTFGGMMMGDLEKHAGIWNSRSQFVKSGISGGPLILFNTSENGQGDSIILSPFSEFMSTSLSINKNTLEYGYMGSIDFIPPNSINSLIIFYSSHGINQLMKEWGILMRLYYSKKAKYRLNDLTINNLGYYTDNGGYYYYHSEPKLNFEETIIRIKENISIPIHYIQLDSWWYWKGLGNGVKQWTAKDNIFPSGLHGLSKKLNSFPLIGHNRYWSSDTIYSSNYSFIIDKENLKSLPYGNDSFWIDLFNQSSSQWNLILYEQDWMNHQTIDFIPLIQKKDLGKNWLISMGKAAHLFHINIQYCMSLPRHALQSLQINRVTQARVSDDYYIHIDKQISQWNIGITSILSDALGLAPFKDIFWSNEIQPGAPYKSNAKEILPDREILIATLSTGPVAVGDGINLVNIERIMKCCRKDGLILKPDKPLTMIDRLISDWAINNGLQQGQIYSTKTILNNQIFSIIFASSMKRNYSISPSMIGSTRSGLIWSFDNLFHLFHFNNNNSLLISKELCHEKSFCLWYNSPLWIFNDSQSTQYAFMGETNKWTFVSRQRFSSLKINNLNTQMMITVKGIPNELVHLAVYHSKFQSIIQLICHFDDQTFKMKLIINSTNVICL